MKFPYLQAFNYTIKPVNGFQTKAVDIYIDGYIVDADTQEFYKEIFGDTTSVSFKSFRTDINNVDADVYNIYINSGGGLVTDAMAMHDFIVELQDKKAKTVNTFIVGMAASAATFIAMASYNPSMSANAWFMIHNVSGGTYGNVDEVENQTRTLRQFNDRCVQFYADRTGLSRTVITNMMKAETWMTATEAKEKGFIKNITAEVKVTNCIKLEHWPYNDMAVLNSYNANVKNEQPDNSPSQIFDDMKKFLQDFKNAFINEFKGVKPTNKADGTIDIDAYNTSVGQAVTNAIETASQLYEEPKPDIENIVNNVAQNAAFTTAVNDAVANAMKGEAFTTAVNTAVKTDDLVKKDDLKPVTDKVAAIDKELDIIDKNRKGGATNTNTGDNNSNGSGKVRGTWAGAK